MTSQTYCCEDCGDDFEDHDDYRAHFTYCYYCEDEFCSMSEEGFWADEIDHFVCNDSDCRRQLHSEGEGVHCYSYRPKSWRPKGNYPADVLMGIELELNGPAGEMVSAVRHIDESEDHLYLCEDTSISQGGAEIISHPMTLEWARDYPFRQLLWELGSFAFPDDETGLHIHVSRNAFRRGGRRSSLHLFLWSSFVYANAAQFSRLGGRVTQRWGRFVCEHYWGAGRTYAPVTEWWQIPDTCPNCYQLMAKARRPRFGHDRYSALNFNNERTVEMRFPKATTNPDTFYSMLELVDASVNYTRQLRVSELHHGMAWAQFEVYVAAHDYPLLWAAMQSAAMQNLAASTETTVYGGRRITLGVPPVPNSRGN